MMIVMVRCVVWMIAITVASCGPSGALTDSGTSGAPGDGHAPGGGVIDSAAPAAITCDPGQALCVGDQLGTCTLGGHDAALLQDCRAAGTSTNPGRCATTGCAGGAHACCMRADEPCAFGFTSPTVDSSGTRYCYPPTLTLNPSCGYLSFNVQGTPAAAPNVCSSDSFVSYGYLDRSKHVAGATFSLATGDSFYLAQTTLGVTRSCSSWTGSVHWVSDVPAWRIEVDLTCTSDATLHVVASFHGTL